MTWQELNHHALVLVRADGYNPHLYDGKIRVRWLRKAWTYGQQRARNAEPPWLPDVKEIGYLIEPVKNLHFRLVERPNGSPSARIAQDVNGLTYIWLATHDVERYVTLFLQIEPFVEGNDRVAFVLRGWLNTLHEITRT